MPDDKEDEQQKKDNKSWKRDQEMRHDMKQYGYIRDSYWR